MNSELFQSAVASIIDAGSSVARAETSLSNAKASLGQRIAYAAAFTTVEMGDGVDEAIAKIRAELGKSKREGAKRATSALNSARPLIPFALSMVGKDKSLDEYEWPSVAVANAVLRGSGLEPSSTSGETWEKAYKKAAKEVAPAVALAWDAAPENDGPAPRALVERKILAAFNDDKNPESRESGGMNIPAVLQWAKGLTTEALDTLIDGLLKIQE